MAWWAVPSRGRPALAAEADGQTATRHQREVGVCYFDAVAVAITGGKSSTAAFPGSTGAAQFHDDASSTRGRDMDVAFK